MLTYAACIQVLIVSGPGNNGGDGLVPFHPPPYRVTWLIRNSEPLGPFRRTMLRALWCPCVGGLFLMSETPLYPLNWGLS
jgi:hypothetical protein